MPQVYLTISCRTTEVFICGMILHQLRRKTVNCRVADQLRTKKALSFHLSSLCCRGGIERSIGHCGECTTAFGSRQNQREFLLKQTASTHAHLPKNADFSGWKPCASSTTFGTALRRPSLTAHVCGVRHPIQ